MSGSTVLVMRGSGWLQVPPAVLTELGLCQQTDPEAFFPEKGASTRDAKRICARCEVKTECLEFALETDQRYGIWGGTSERERRRLRANATGS